MQGKYHILVIDGDEISCAAISRMIEKAGYQTSEAFNGIHALEMLKENRHIEAIILNRTLSGVISSIDFMHRIQALPAAIKNIPVVMLTDRAEKNRIKSSMIFGISDVVYKPIDETLLHKTLEKTLQKSHKGKV
jgi:two-component system response regulator AtoC